MVKKRAEPSDVDQAEQLSSGSVFARYEIVRCIGVGGMGAVFEAHHSLLRKRVALKTLHASLGRSETARARFLREAENVARIRHPHVVDISDVGVENGVPFLVMEYLEGEDLGHRLERERRLAPEAALEVLIPIVSGLAAVHRLGIVHRDVKPENILLARDVRGDVVPKLVDFGVSKDLEASIRSGGPLVQTVTGTPHYMAPEQARGSVSLDARADQYAVGILLYQCLGGARPYESDSLLELIHLIDCGEHTPLRSHAPEVSRELEAVVHRAMTRHPRDRFPSTEALGQALLEFANEPTRQHYARDFSHERLASAVLISVTEGLAERLSAPTVLANEPFRIQPSEHGTSSGVRARGEPAAARPASGDASVKARSWRAFVWGALVTAVVCGLAAWVWSARAPSAPRPPRASFVVRLEVRPAEAIIALDGKSAGRGRLLLELPRDGRQHTLQVAADGFESRTLVFRDAPPPETAIALSPRGAAAPPSALVPAPQTDAPAQPVLAPNRSLARQRSRAARTPVTVPESTPAPEPDSVPDIQLSR